MQRKKHIYKIYGFKTSKKSFEKNRKCYKDLGLLGNRITIDTFIGIDGVIYHNMNENF